MYESWSGQQRTLVITLIIANQGTCALSAVSVSDGEEWREFVLIRGRRTTANGDFDTYGAGRTGSGVRM